MARLPGFGDRLRTALIECGMTQADLARATGKTSGSVVRWIRGEIPTLETLRLIARATASPATFLVLGDVVYEELAELNRRAREPERARGSTRPVPTARTSVARAGRRRVRSA